MEGESPAERTDPLLPVITADLVLPVPPPALDDRRLAGLLAELDAEDLLPGDAPTDAAGNLPRPAGNSPRPAGNLPRPAGNSPRPAGNLPAPRPARPEPRRVPPLVIDTEADPAPDPAAADPAPDPAGRYVRRDYRPPELPADAMGLTGLSRVGGSRFGTVVFTAFFLGIFLLILVEVVVSLLRVA